MEGLFLSRDGVWSMLRKVWQPTFHSESLHGYAPVMASETRRLVARLRGLAAAQEGDAAGSGAPAINIWREVGRMTMSVVGSTAYGVDFDLLAQEEGQGGSVGQEAAQPGQEDGAPARMRSRSGGAALVQAAADMFECSEIGNATRYLVAAHLMPVLVPVLQLLVAVFPDARYKRLVHVRAGGGGGHNRRKQP
jgi:thromboxane-A synthase/cytochrome P450 family 3 subfamily A